MKQNLSRSMIAAKEQALACFAALADEAPQVQLHLERLGLKANQPFQQFYWSYCPEDALETEKKISAEKFKESVGSEHVFTEDGGRTRLGHVSPLLESLRLQTEAAGLPKTDWVKFTSQRERAERAAIEANQPKANQARSAAVAASQARRRKEAASIVPVLGHPADGPTDKWIAAAISRYFGEFGFEPVRKVKMDGAVAYRRRRNGACVGIAVKEMMALMYETFTGDYGLNLIIELDSPDGPVQTAKGIFDIVDGFRVYNICQKEEDALLTWFAHAEVFRILAPRLDSCLAAL